MKTFLSSWPIINLGPLDEDLISIIIWTTAAPFAIESRAESFEECLMLVVSVVSEPYIFDIFGHWYVGYMVGFGNLRSDYIHSEI
jgi:hypothetical protein